MSLVDLLRDALPASYSIDGDLKGGGEGSVFAGRYESLSAAIKVFRPDTDPKRRQREVECLLKVASPTLVKILGVDNVALEGVDHVVVAYELHTGGDLCGLVDSPSETTGTDLLTRISLDISLAVVALWQHRIVHRDIKPANIVRSDGGGFILVDVGLARHIDRSDLTAVGFAAGTPGYMSPEQARGRRSLTYKSDLFSLGVTLYEIAVGEHPFRRQQARIGTVSPPPLQSHRQDLPDALCRLIDRMMSIRPADRPSDVPEAIRNLRS